MPGNRLLDYIAFFPNNCQSTEAYNLYVDLDIEKEQKIDSMTGVGGNVEKSKINFFCFFMP